MLVILLSIHENTKWTAASFFPRSESPGKLTRHNETKQNENKTKNRPANSDSWDYSNKNTQPGDLGEKTATQQGPSTPSELVSDSYWCLKYKHTANSNIECKKGL